MAGLLDQRKYVQPVHSCCRKLCTVVAKFCVFLFTENCALLIASYIYAGLMTSIINNIEINGDKTCEISGLKFQLSFEHFFAKTLKEVKYPENKISAKDQTINRCWFPLIGGLGSDAQALPQAKFAVNIHPICLVVMQTSFID